MSDELLPEISEATLLQQVGAMAYLAAEPYLRKGKILAPSNHPTSTSAQVYFIWAQLFKRAKGMADVSEADTVLSGLGKLWHELLNNAGQMRVLHCETGGTSKTARGFLTQAVKRLQEFGTKEFGMTFDQINAQLNAYHDANCQCTEHIS